MSADPRLPPVLLSLHDVMPATWDAVCEAMRRLDELGIRGVVLLVVPGFGWMPKQVDQLRRWQDAGHVLAGHGWSHQCGSRRTWWHRLHSLCLSRNAAEHLSLDEREVADRVVKCYRWFHTVGLGNPALYVPPAWAMGAMPRRLLRTLPFRYYETLRGIYDSHGHRYRRLPLMGFEADSPLRAAFLRCFNTANSLAAAVLHCPLRVAIHPFDFSHRLAEPLRRLLAARPRTLQVAHLFGAR